MLGRDPIFAIDQIIDPEVRDKVAGEKPGGFRAKLVLGVRVAWKAAQACMKRQYDKNSRITCLGCREGSPETIYSKSLILLKITSPTGRLVSSRRDPGATRGDRMLFVSSYRPAEDPLGSNKTLSYYMRTGRNLDETPG